MGTKWCSVTKMEAGSNLLDVQCDTCAPNSLVLQEERRREAAALEIDLRTKREKQN